jgi:hypothetical protein
MADIDSFLALAIRNEGDIEEEEEEEEEDENF